MKCILMKGGILTNSVDVYEMYSDGEGILFREAIIYLKLT